MQELLPALRLTTAGSGPDAFTVGWDASGGHSGVAGFPLFLAAVRVAGPSGRYPVAWGCRRLDADALAAAFTAEETAGLRPGQGWADGRVMRLGDFEELDEDSC